MNILPLLFTLTVVGVCRCVNKGNFHSFQPQDIEELTKISDDFNERAKTATADGANITLDTHPKRLLDEVQKTIHASGDLELWLEKFLNDDDHRLTQGAMEELIDINTQNEKIVFRNLLELSDLFRGARVPSHQRMLDIVEAVEKASKNVHLITAVLFMNLDELKPLLIPLSKSNVIASMPLQDRHYEKFVDCVRRVRKSRKVRGCFDE